MHGDSRLFRDLQGLVPSKQSIKPGNRPAGMDAGNRVPIWSLMWEVEGHVVP